MIQVILVVQLIVTITMIGLILIQRSEGGGLGIAGTTRAALNIEVGAFMALYPSEKLAAGHREVIGDGTEREARQEGETAKDQDDPDQ